jgi:hypothetical protein
MRNTNRRFDLWQIQSSDYPADMRKSIPNQEMWRSDLFAPRGGVCARLARDVFRAVDDSRLSTKSPFAHLNDPSVQRAVPALQTELRHCLIVTRQRELGDIPKPDAVVIAGGR